MLFILFLTLNCFYECILEGSLSFEARIKPEAHEIPAYLTLKKNKTIKKVFIIHFWKQNNLSLLKALFKLAFVFHFNKLICLVNIKTRI